MHIHHPEDKSTNVNDGNKTWSYWFGNKEGSGGFFTVDKLLAFGLV
jgi:hypothetical protein